MTPQEFVKKYYPHAKAAENKTEVSALAILVQGAIESGWGKSAPGNMFFGQKDIDGVNGNEQLLTTHEYNKCSTLTAKQIGLARIDSITPTVIKGVKFFKYVGKAYFRKYNTAEECFIDHAMFFKRNKRYAKAMAVASNADLFLQEVAKAGYAQNPSYGRDLSLVLKIIKKHAQVK